MLKDIRLGGSSCSYPIIAFETAKVLFLRFVLLDEAIDCFMNLIRSSVVEEFVKMSSAHTIAIGLQCRHDVLDSTFYEHAANKAKTLAAWLLCESFV